MKCKLGDLVSVDTGCPFRGKVRNVPDGRFRVIQAKDINAADHSVISSGLWRTDDVPSPDRYAVAEDNLVFAPRGTRNFATPVPLGLRDTVAAGHFYILRLKAGIVLPEYLAWYINQPPAQAYLKSHARGSGIQMIPRDAVAGLRVDVPSIERQKAITELGRLGAMEYDLTVRLSEARHRLMQAQCLRAARA